jgi:hypothetical protein
MNPQCGFGAGFFRVRDHIQLKRQHLEKIHNLCRLAKTVHYLRPVGAFHIMTTR